MERELWPVWYHSIPLTAKEVRQKYVPIHPWVLVATRLGAALPPRPVSGACPPAPWSTTRLRPGRIPAEATRSRRVDQVATGGFGRAREQRRRGRDHPALLAFSDGK